MCFVVTCWEGAGLLALVCGVFCEFVTFPLVSWVRCGTWLYRFLIFASLLTLLKFSIIFLFAYSSNDGLGHDVNYTVHNLTNDRINCDPGMFKTQAINKLPRSTSIMAELTTNSRFDLIYISCRMKQELWDISLISQGSSQFRQWHFLSFLRLIQDIRLSWKSCHSTPVYPNSLPNRLYTE